MSEGGEGFLGYFERVGGKGGMHVRYCEVMVDLQAHTRRGVGVDAVLRGLGSARDEAWGVLVMASNPA